MANISKDEEKKRDRVRAAKEAIKRAEENKSNIVEEVKEENKSNITKEVKEENKSNITKEVKEENKSNITKEVKEENVYDSLTESTMVIEDTKVVDRSMEIDINENETKPLELEEERTLKVIPLELVDEESSDDINKPTLEDYKDQQTKRLKVTDSTQKKNKTSMKYVAVDKTLKVRKKLIKILIVLIIIFSLIVVDIRKKYLYENSVSNVDKYQAVSLYDLPIKEVISEYEITNEEATLEYSGEEIGYVQIPSVGLKVSLYQSKSGDENDMQDAMKYTVAHDPQTLLPGEGGNIVITGHREQHFKKLEGVALDDLIIVGIKENTYLYKVSEVKIVDEEGSDNIEYVYGDTGKEQLVLYTCYPFKSLTSPDQRYVVKANRISRYNNDINFNDEFIELEEEK